MKKLLFALLAAVSLSAAAVAPPPPSYTFNVNITPGQPVYTFAYAILECNVYGVPCPQPEGVFYLTFNLTQVAEGPAAITLNDTNYSIAPGGRGSCCAIFHTTYSNFSVADVSGNLVGSWNGQDWSAADLPAGVYTFKVEADSTYTSTHNNTTYVGNRVYLDITFQ